MTFLGASAVHTVSVPASPLASYKYSAALTCSSSRYKS